MRCDEFEDRLNELMDQGRSPTEWGSVQTHARSCRDCRELLSSYRLLWEAIEARCPSGDAHGPRRVVAVSRAPFAERVVSEYARRRPRRSARWSVALAAGLAASLAIAVWGGWRYQQPGRPVAMVDRTDLDDERAAPMAVPGDAGAMAGESELDLPRTAEDLRSIISHLSETLREGERQGVEPLQAGLFALTTSVEAALDGLKNALAPMETRSDAPATDSALLLRRSFSC